MSLVVLKQKKLNASETMGHKTCKLIANPECMQAKLVQDENCYVPEVSECVLTGEVNKSEILSENWQEMN